MTNAQTETELPDVIDIYQEVSDILEEISATYRVADDAPVWAGPAGLHDHIGRSRMT